MLDLHVHVLPGIDDGPRTMEDALALARALADDGIEHIVATPHIYPGVFDNSAARIGETFDAFQAAVSDAGINLTMTWAAEVRICPEILEWIELRRLPMLNGSLVGPSTALIELPDGQIPVGTDKLMGMMLERGITPLMAHPERNKAVMEQPNRLDALRRLGCQFQVTAGSLLGDFGARAQSTAQTLLEAGWVDVIASDSHNRSSRRPRMGAARDWLTEHFDAALALRLTKTQPTEIAGVSSFTVQAGEQRLVFRDLPAMAPLDTSGQWSVDQMLEATSAQRPAEPTETASATSEAWSLIDFRIDAVVDELQSVSLRNDPFAEASGAATAPLQAHPPSTPEPSEDWQLPTFQSSARTTAPAPRTPDPVPRPVSPARPLAPVSTPVVPVVTPDAVATLIRPIQPVTAVVKEKQAPAPVSERMASAQLVQESGPEATTSPPALRGLRLSDVPVRLAVVPMTKHAAPDPQTSARPAPMAMAGHQGKSLASIARSIVTAVRSDPADNPPRPMDTETPEGTRRGFRLRDLNPLPNRRR